MISQDLHQQMYFVSCHGIVDVKIPIFFERFNDFTLKARLFCQLLFPRSRMNFEPLNFSFAIKQSLLCAKQVDGNNSAATQIC